MNVPLMTGRVAKRRAVATAAVTLLLGAAATAPGTNDEVATASQGAVRPAPVPGGVAAAGTAIMLAPEPTFDEGVTTRQQERRAEVAAAEQAEAIETAVARGDDRRRAAEEAAEQAAAEQAAAEEAAEQAAAEEAAAREAAEQAAAEEAAAQAAAEEAAEPAAGSTWDRVADCESGEWDGNAVPIPGSATWDYSGGTFEGGLQFQPSTWDGFRDGDMPGHAGAASRSQQIVVAERVLAAQGWGAWPVCSRKLGLR